MFDLGVITVIRLPSVFLLTQCLTSTGFNFEVFYKRVNNITGVVWVLFTGNSLSNGGLVLQVQLQ